MWKNWNILDNKELVCRMQVPLFYNPAESTSTSHLEENDWDYITI